MKMMTWVAGSLVVLSMSLLPGPLIQARPTYSEKFKATYATELADNQDNKSCVVCHSAETPKKSVRNNYGDAIKETLKGKNVKDSDSILNALREAEEMPSAVPGKTFGELIREGRLPASK